MKEPFTPIQTNATWTTVTHLGTEYAALLVEPGYHPAANIGAVPGIGGGVIAVAVVKGQLRPPSPSLLFSGYEWRSRDSPSDRGGHNLYDPKNAWTDDAGALHLRISGSPGKWHCAEVTLTRSLGYGTYSFVVRDISQLEPAAVFGMFTWDYAGANQNHREMDIEISRWGYLASENAQYVVQPYDIARNVFRFSVPPGRHTHSFRWEAGGVSFCTNAGAGKQQPRVAQHVFTSGVPSTGAESVRMSLYAFGFADNPLEKGTEVVVEKFQYLP